MTIFRNKLVLPEYNVHDPDRNGKKYTLHTPMIEYVCPKTGRTLTLYKGYKSDGATGAFDIRSNAWWIHDLICDRGTWDNGDKIKNWEASAILSRLLALEGRPFRAGYWFLCTFAFGGGKARDNGMF